MRSTFQIWLNYFLVALVLSVPCARADTVYDWSLSGPASGSGSLTLAPGMQSGQTCNFPPGNGFISGMTGVLDGSPITFVDTVPFGGCVTPEVSNYMMDLSTGASTSLFTAGNNWTLEDNSFANEFPGAGNVYVLDNGTVLSGEYITIVNDSPVGTPEPSVMLLLIAGLGGMLIWRKSGYKPYRTWA